MTISEPVELQGVGLHTGRTVRVRLLPGPVGQGITFRRTDLDSEPVPALTEWVVGSDRRTAIEREGARVETVEHLLAAAAAMGIDDLRVELDGPEMPILDGSFRPFQAALSRGGARALPGEPTWIAPETAMELQEGDSWYRVDPSERLEFDVTIQVDHPRIGRQRWRGVPMGETFETAIGPARTWGLLREVEMLRDRGLLQGASTDCAIVLSETEVVNTTLHWPDEFVRHKAGDLLGDLALAGGRLRARVTARQPGHRGNQACARALRRLQEES